jgi:hypothetical protein
LGADRAMRPEIRQHWEIDATHPFGKYLVRKNRINAYAQDLSVAAFEFLAISFEAT